MKLFKKGKEWWIDGDDAGPMGPYSTKQEATSDLRGLRFTMQEFDNHSFATSEKEKPEMPKALPKSGRKIKKTTTAAPATTKRRPEPTTEDDTLCHCGCGDTLKPKRSFRQGHDGRFHSRVRRAVAGILTMDELRKEIQPYAVQYYEEAINEES